MNVYFKLGFYYYILLIMNFYSQIGELNVNLIVY